jgi:membrane-bound lytic murein transglycosylase B
VRVATGAIVVGMVVVATLGCTSDADSTTSAPHADADATATTTAATSTTSTTATSSTTTDSPNPGLGEPPARLATPPDAAGIAMRLSTAHATMVDVAAPGEARAAAGIDHQLVLRALADRPELDDAVLRALDPESRPTVERTIRARQFLQQRNATRPPQPLPDELPAWTIVEPEPIDTLLARYAEAERLTGIPWYWLAAIHLQETRMGRVQGTSTADAVGPMQFLPSTWAACCTGDPTVTRDAIIGAATYLAQSGGPADMAAAVYQYNPNDGYVSVVTAYAENLRDLPELYAGYHAFQVFFATSAGTVRLPVGYSTSTPITVSEYLDAHPQDAA